MKPGKKIIEEFYESASEIIIKTHDVKSNKFIESWEKCYTRQQNALDNLARTLNSNIDEATNIYNGTQKQLLLKLKGKIQNSVIDGLDKKISQATSEEAKSVLEAQSKSLKAMFNDAKNNVIKAMDFTEGFKGLAAKGYFTVKMPYNLFHPESLFDDVAELAIKKELASGVDFLLDWGATIYTVNSLSIGGISLVRDYKTADNMDFYKNLDML